MEQFDFGARLNHCIHDVFHHGGASRTEAELTDGQKVFLNAVRRELQKYPDPNRQGYPHTALEQMEAFCRTLGDLHKSYYDMGYHKISDCLFNRWKMVYAECKRLADTDVAKQPAWHGIHESEKTDMPAFFDA